MSKQPVHLPVLRRKSGTLPKPRPFVAGMKVTLVCCADAPPGTVRAMRYGRVHVEWHDIDIVGRHSPNALAKVD